MIQCLVKEIELRKEELHNQFIDTIYFGGGTPSLLNNTELELLIDSINKNYAVIENPEITLEANPDDLSEKRIIELSQSRINRLSIGVQSFFDDDLKNMNRAHNANESLACLEYASEYFDNITIDLIYGIPNMSLEKWRTNLDMALSFDVNHISSYALTVEPKTALDTFVKKGIYPPMDEELALQHFNALISKTSEHGFVHYEISNFGKPRYFSKHNTSYWQGKPYLGIGPSAHSFYGDQRSWNVSNNIKYIQSIQKGALPNTVELLSNKDQYNEYVMTGLRTIWGVSFENVKMKFGSNLHQHIKAASEKFVEQGLLEIVQSYADNKGSTLKTTQKGKFLVDGIASELFMI